MTTRRVFSPESSAFAQESNVRVTTGNALGYYDTATHELATVAWRPGDVESATIEERRLSIVVRLTLPLGRTAHVRYGSLLAADADAARATLADVDRAMRVTMP
jgi:hypothetical protein